ncbi:prolyl aminopeptidase [Kutzneria kofuensis]|uniref:Proline iminopeptidase n=1 Tax=Kutzneria kofuensis TaxID=103725 RepID=A0A7W9KBC6_9PSEU|nr:prolyl aminopeptidase [Kutzneria kofuensis]MBB5889392.1 proline iminopeptidase [Kutzneria kofuensis]
MTIEPYDRGLLDVGDGNRIYWETSGNPDGKVALCVHGGPGGGGTRGARRAFDPERFRIVLFDQRGCGESLPNAADPAVDMSCNTTEHLIADMERLREHLGVERWLLYGGSWASTLILAYAERFPERVSEIILISTTLSTRAESDWLYGGGLRLLLPDAYEAFAGAVAGDDLLAGYEQLLTSPDPAVREKAAADWCAWEDAVIAHETLGRPGQYGGHDGVLAMVRIIVHYARHNAFLEDGQLLRDVHRLAGIPAVVVHGRRDLSCPLLYPWELVRAWPSADLVIVEDSGHTGSPAMGEAIGAAVERFSPPLLNR